MQYLNNGSSPRQIGGSATLPILGNFKGGLKPAYVIDRFQRFLFAAANDLKCPGVDDAQSESMHRSQQGFEANRQPVASQPSCPRAPTPAPTADAQRPPLLRTRSSSA